MFGENVENSEVSKKDVKKIENEMFAEMLESSYEHNPEGAKVGKENKINSNETIDLGGSQQQIEKVSIPTEVFKPTYIMVSDIINGYRLKNIAQKHHERASEILAPTDKEVELANGLTGYLVGYLERKYGANILNNPWVGPLMLVGKFGLVQVEKEKALRTYLSVASAGGEK